HGQLTDAPIPDQLGRRVRTFHAFSLLCHGALRRCQRRAWELRLGLPADGSGRGRDQTRAGQAEGAQPGLQADHLHQVDDVRSLDSVAQLEQSGPDQLPIDVATARDLRPAGWTEDLRVEGPLPSDLALEDPTEEG